MRGARRRRTDRRLRDHARRHPGAQGEADVLKFEGYEPLLQQIALFFKTGKPPVAVEETIELMTFMEAADESKCRNGKPVTLDEVWTKAKKEAGAKMKEWTTKHS